MTTYCPSCGMNVNVVEKESPRGKVWLCAQCGLGFKQNPDPAARRNTSETDTSGTKKTWSDSAPSGNKQLPINKNSSSETKNNAPPAPEHSWETGGIELDEDETSSFIVESINSEPLLTVKQPLEIDLKKSDVSHSLEKILFSRVAVADDAKLLRELVRDALLQEGICREVRDCKSGEELLQMAAEQIADHHPLDLVILDVEMPIISGPLAAVSLRAFERGLKLKPTPIIFFTAHACEEKFRQIMDYCQPARYLNKGSDGTPSRIAARLVQVLSSLRG